MLGFFQRKLTEYSDHYIDWSRIGELIRSGSHKYSAEELLNRGVIIGTTAIFSFLGACYNNQEKSGYANSTIMIAAGLLGFTISHTVIILPLIKKRLQMHKDCEQLTAKIQDQLTTLTNNTPDFAPTRELINQVIINIKTLSLSDNDHARASQTWGKRRRLLTNLYENLLNEPTDFWEGEAEDVIIKLDHATLKCKTSNLI